MRGDLSTENSLNHRLLKDFSFSKNQNKLYKTRRCYVKVLPQKEGKSSKKVWTLTSSAYYFNIVLIFFINSVLNLD